VETNQVALDLLALFVSGILVLKQLRQEPSVKWVVSHMRGFPLENLEDVEV
jgi:di/tricarboxylate transporter